MSASGPRFPLLITLLQDGKLYDAAQWIVKNLEPWEYISATVDVFIQLERDDALYKTGYLAASVQELTGGKHPLRYITPVGDLAKAVTDRTREEPNR